MAWTDKSVELLTKLWQEGLSASQIAAELGKGVTRNAVIGKVHRLGLSGRSQPVATKRQRKPRAAEPCEEENVVLAVGNRVLDAKVAQLSAVAAAVRADGFLPEAKRITIEKLTERTCKWPIGDPGQGDFGFCGRDAREGLPYCEHHARIAYQAGDASRRLKRAVG